jgi:hypothetical protein
VDEDLVMVAYKYQSMLLRASADVRHESMHTAINFGFALPP